MTFSPYEKFDIGINLGTEYLINENAFFLGGIIAANETTMIRGDKYWVAPVRHNKEYLSDEDIESHFYHVRKIASKLSNETLLADSFSRNGIHIPKFNKRMKGFATFFKSDQNVTIESIISEVGEAIVNSVDEVKRCFILGLFDGRGAIDLNKSNNSIRYISLDCDNEIVARTLLGILEDFGLNANYNMARERVEGGRRRENQLRIKDVKVYMEKVGFISRKKLNVASTCFGVSPTSESEVLDGLKIL
ncbi:LAGLIDADG family homing endonuclease [Paenibacillus polymyxa]|uniref:LAGLIDADG family homing endonuclease n=1 Tax=Paenibacillus polymyxa TaxID=1406 RepID=UPI00298D2276|nr:LAGLIDADG family homing endonuclease [Paenibacillus polymyxa]